MRKNDDLGDVDDLSSEEILNTLIRYVGGSVRPLWTERSGTETKWYRVSLNPTELGSLRVIESPSGMGWQKLAPDERMITAVRSIRNGDQPPESLIDAEYIHERAQTIGNTSATEVENEEVGRTERVILFKQADGRPPRVADGNHRTAAHLYHHLEGEPVPPLKAYLGIRTTSLVQHAVDRAQHSVRTRLFGHPW